MAQAEEGGGEEVGAREEEDGGGEEEAAGSDADSTAHGEHVTGAGAGLAAATIRASAAAAARMACACSATILSSAAACIVQLPPVDQEAESRENRKSCTKKQAVRLRRRQLSASQAGPTAQRTSAPGSTTRSPRRQQRGRNDGGALSW